MKGRLFVHFITLIPLNELRSKVSVIKPRDRKYWDSKDMLNQVATYSQIHFTGKLQGPVNGTHQSTEADLRPPKNRVPLKGRDIECRGA
jgi:hypothetical protein